MLPAQTPPPKSAAAPAAADGWPETDLRGAIDAFSEVAAALNRDMELDPLLHLVCDKLCGLVGVERASLYLQDRSNGDLGLFRGQVARQDVYDQQVKAYVCGGPADAFTREILATKRPVLVTNAQTDPRPVRAQMRRWGVRSMLGVPMIVGDEVRGLVFLDNGPIQHDYTLAQQAIAQTFANLAMIAVSQSTARTQLNLNMETVERQNKLLRRGALINDRLTGLVLGGAGVGEIAQEIHELTGHPCTVHDAQFRRIAAAGAASDGGDPVSVLDERFRRQAALAPTVGQLRHKRSVVFEPSPALGLDRRYLAAAARAHGVPLGYVVLQERRTRFGSLDTLIAQRSAGIIALELVVSARGAESELDARRALMSELIREQADLPLLVRRAERLQAELDRPRLVFVISARNRRSHVPPTIRQLIGAIAADGRIPDVLAAEIAEDVVVAAQLPAGDPAVTAGHVRDAVESACRTLAGPHELLIAVSSVCERAEDYSRAYFEAAQIVTALREHLPPTVGSEVIQVGSSDLGAARMLLVSHTPRQLDDLLGSTFGSLLDEPDPLGTGLLATLEAYFRASQSTGRTADLLGVHKNTVRNRLARIEQLAPLAVVSDPDARLRAQLALRVLQLRARFGGEDAAPAELDAG